MNCANCLKKAKDAPQYAEIGGRRLYAFGKGLGSLADVARAKRERLEAEREEFIDGILEKETLRQGFDKLSLTEVAPQRKRLTWRDRARHWLNPLHFYCTLELAMPRTLAIKIARGYEQRFYLRIFSQKEAA
ncbi:MAG: hypothetical protein HZB29_09960 [Nitrospinae bacterium]|nr:hypothetical protein [Nitrospinota bacterium]